jgi:activator-of-BECN1-regulated-autophagy protein 1
LWFANNVGPSGGGSAWAPHSDMGFFSGSPGGANQTHRLQCWDYSRLQVPDLRNSEANVIVSKAKIFNDASVDVNDEGTLLAALVPIENQMSVNLCIYSLERKTFSQCLYLWTFGMNAISVSLSPLSRYIVVGLSTPRSVYSMSYPPAEESVTVGQVFQLSDAEKSCPRLEHVRNINVSRGDESFSLNSIRWLPHAGDGFIYGTNRGHLVICRPEASVKCCNNPWSASGNVGNSRTSTGTQTVMSPVRASRSLSLSSTSSSEFSSSRSRTNLSSNSPQTNADDSSASVQGDQ